MIRQYQDASGFNWRQLEATAGIRRQTAATGGHWSSASPASIKASPKEGGLDESKN
jgi:hypothetical protein